MKTSCFRDVYNFTLNTFCFIECYLFFLLIETQTERKIKKEKKMKKRENKNISRRFPRKRDVAYVMFMFTIHAFLFFSLNRHILYSLENGIFASFFIKMIFYHLVSHIDYHHHLDIILPIPFHFL